MINRQVQAVLNSPILEAKKGSRNAISLTVSKFYCDVDGVVIDPLTLPVNLATNLPYFLFNEIDRLGGLYNFIRTVKLGAWNLWQTFTFGIDNTPLLFTGSNDLQANFSNGDLVTVYTDSLVAPNYYAFIVVKKEFGGYMQLINNPQFSENYKSVEIVLQTDNVQLNENIYVNKYDLMGNVKSASFVPREFKNPKYKIGDTVYIPLDFNPTKYLGLISHIVFSINSFQITFILETK